MLKSQGWYNALDFPTQLTANNTNTEGDGHEAFQALSSNQQASVKLMKAEQDNYTDGKRHVLRFTPHIEVFHLNKLLVPGVQIGIQMYFNSPNLFLNGVNVAGRLTRKCQSKNVPVSSKAQPQRLPRVDDENERQQKYSCLPNREK